MNYFWDFLTSNGGSEFLVLLAPAAAKSVVLLALVALLCSLFPRFTAATKHLVWSLVICASLVLPGLSFLMIWEVPILPAALSVSSESVSNELAEYNELNATSEMRFVENNSVREQFEVRANTELSNEASFAFGTSNFPASSPKNVAVISPMITGGILAVWFVGAVLLFIRLLIGFAATNLLARRAAEFKENAIKDLFSSLAAEFDLNGKVRLMCSERTLMPIVCGVLRPAVLLPAGAAEWSEERLRLVLPRGAARLFDANPGANRLRVLLVQSARLVCLPAFAR
jgi:beta-lactamase regulating signal transducer with metallopeptidase domain